MKRKIIKWIGNIFLSLILFFAGSLFISSVVKGHTAFFNYSLVEVQSNSMNKSGIYRGDLYIVVPKSEYEVHDIVAFELNGQIWFHEIIETNGDTLTTKGSSNHTADPSIDKTQIIGYKCSGNLKFLNSKTFKISAILMGYLICLGLLTDTALEIVKDTEEKKKVEQPYKKIKQKYPRRGKKKNNKTLFLILFLGGLLSVGMPAISAYAASNSTAICSVEMTMSYKTTTSSSYVTFSGSRISGYDNTSGETTIVFPSVSESGEVVTSIDSGVINNNNYVETIIIPSTVQQIGQINFMFCSNLKTIIVQAEDPITKWSSWFGLQLGSSVKIYVPDSAVAAYKSASGWSKYSSQIFPISTYQ